MKLIIEVTEEYYEFLKDKSRNNKASVSNITILDGTPYEESSQCNQLKNGCPFKDKLNEYFGKYRIGLCASRHNYTKEEFIIRERTLMDLEMCVANAYADLIYKGNPPNLVWEDFIDQQSHKNREVMESDKEAENE